MMIAHGSTAPTRQSGRLIAREHREPRPAYSLSVLYFAGRPTEAEDLCSPRYCGPPLTIKIEATSEANGSRLTRLSNTCASSARPTAVVT